MNNNQITIFFSWQSDLPSKDNRNLIEEVLKKVKKEFKDRVDIKIEKDTKGESGAPDIVESIFKKIDKSDIFIADVTNVGSYSKLVDDKQRKIINQNVLFELGYACKVVGWDNVVCFGNDAYACDGDGLFDIEHRRICHFNSNNDLKKVKDNIKQVIISAIEHKMAQGNSKNSLKIIDYKSEETNKAIIVRTDFCKKEFLIDLDNEATNKLKELVEFVNHEKIPKLGIEIETSSKTREMNQIYDALSKKCPLATISNGWKKTIEDYAESKNIKLDEETWKLGELKIGSYSQPLGTLLYGTDDEKEKYKLIEDLYDKIVKFNAYKDYFKSIDNLYFVKLALFNDDMTYGEDIDINLILKKDYLVLPEYFPIPKNEIIDEINEFKFITNLFSLDRRGGINKYPDDNYQIENIHVNNYIPDILGYEPSYEEKKENYIYSINEVFNYDVNDKEEHVDYINVYYDNIKQHTKIAFPSCLVFKDNPKEIKYEIIAKHKSDVITGDIKLVDN